MKRELIMTLVYAIYFGCLTYRYLVGGIVPDNYQLMLCVILFITAYKPKN